MVMRRWLIAGLLGVAPGCLKAAPPGTITAVGCPDPLNCTHSNGSGVYTAEDGFAGLGTPQLMITHFINTGSTVTFQGRYFSTAAKGWQALTHPGTVAASFGGKGMNVVSVTEAATLPRWTLQDPTALTAPPTVVTGEALRALVLLVRFDANDAVQQFFLDFAGSWDVALPNTGKQRVALFNMQWRDLANPNLVKPYCLDAAGRPDAVVFQRGMDIDPVTGAVARSPKNPDAASFVTLSCYLGAPATVYRWGYDYTDATFYFDAGIQMKRASYCGDWDHYTVSGTPIQIEDDAGGAKQPINNDPIRFLEASWQPQGAKCVNLDNMRHRGTMAKPGFTGRCGGVQLPTCNLPPTQLRASPFLLDGPVQPAP